MSRGRLSAGLMPAARAAGISDERVLEAMNATPRAGFVPARYVTAAYRDEPIPIAALRAGCSSSRTVTPFSSGSG